MQCMADKKRLTVDFDEDFYREFSVACAERDTTKAEVVRSQVRRWIDE